MKKALIATALIGVLGMTVAFAGPGGGDCGGKGGHGGFGGHRAQMGEMLTKKLDLTAEQQTQVDAIMKEQRTKMDEMRQQMQKQMQ